MRQQVEAAREGMVREQTAHIGRLEAMLREAGATPPVLKAMPGIRMA